MVRHLNDCKTDNRLENLVFGTQSQNTRDSMRNGKYNHEAAAKGRVIGGAKGRTRGNAAAVKKLSKPVKCIETGIIYPSACEASRQLGIHYLSICYCCNGKQKTAGGFHWEFVIDQKEIEN